MNNSSCSPNFWSSRMILSSSSRSATLSPTIFTSKAMINKERERSTSTCQSYLWMLTSKKAGNNVSSSTKAIRHQTSPTNSAKNTVIFTLLRPHPRNDRAPLNPPRNANRLNPHQNRRGKRVRLFLALLIYLLSLLPYILTQLFTYDRLY